MSIYLAVAGMPVNIFLIMGLGGLVGIMSGLFGVGGGFLLTPLLMMVGVPPAVAAASDSNQIVAASSSGAIAHKRLGNVDMKMGIIFLVGGVMGGTVGAQLVKILRGMGNYDFAVKVIYVVVLAGIGSFMFIESLNALRGRVKQADVSKPSVFKRLMISMPFQTEFKVSGIRASILFVVGLGFVVGLMAALMGVGGGFITVPAMIYLLGMPTMAAIGTDLFQIVFTSMNVVFQQAITNHTVDIVLAVLLFCGSTIGAQVGARFSKRFRGEQLRILLAVIVLAVMVQMFIGLISAPADIIGLTKGGGGH
ncbi:sulfite exporter TauE/SafE family protein [Desulfotomaculum copahuensis]|uniref:Probable membrane transporter protein n=1 Tax=Desulfotomaculum copahuensis TaxID=1838280 RepID=A0A1B7LI18_9FIRM|nr:sulfite exporter TauE/SafE family protein [Desulfotomaculum copahuensis]OAT85843.1 permease [Desulfotomaculum copahuensis]